MGKRFITQKALSETPEPKEGQLICKVSETQGGGVFKVLSEESSVDLVTLPSKFQKLLWVRRGTFVIVNPEDSPKGKVKGEIVNVLLPQDVKDLQRSGKWPSIFNAKELSESEDENTRNSNEHDEEWSDKSDLDDMFQNSNRWEAESSEDDEPLN